MTSTHPLEPLTRQEVDETIQILRAAGYMTPTTRVACVLLREPAKQFVFTWNAGAHFPRIAEATLFDNGRNLCSKAQVCLRRKAVESHVVIPGVQPLITVDEMEECERVVVESEEFAAKVVEHFGANHPAAKMENLICDIWSAGYYGEEGDGNVRLARPLCFFKDPQSQNPYAYPIEGLRPVVDLNQMRLVRVEDYGKFPLPPSHYASHRANGMSELRRDVKPLEIVQKYGPSFKVSGKQVYWQKWSFVVGFNAKEGLSLHDVRYEGRPILYRAAISDMVVPYGDPSRQQARKNAFDVSDYGIGHCTNSLKLGCDCLGEIKYFDGELVNSRGDGWSIENAICMHEEDFGVIWKHFDRHSNSNEIRRSRRLVVSSFATVENYDYGFYWYFYQDGNIQLEVKLTGFLSIGSRGPEDPAPKFGNLVAPQVYAPNHQHFFNFRMDFAIDGVKNTVSQVDVVPEPNAGDPQRHPFGNAFYAQKTPYETEKQALSNVSVEKSRTWLISNEARRNLVGMPVAYKFMPGENTVPYASPDAWWRKRARFVDHHVWVTPFDESEMCCAGEFPNQAKEDQGLIKWTAKNRKIDGEDCVMWYTFGVTHVPRPEDYPVMPTVYTGFWLKPFGFFDRNPAFDVPPQCQVNEGLGGSRKAKL